MAISEAKRKANKKWDEKNKERKKYINYRSTTKRFVKSMATLEDLETLTELIEDRKKELN